MRFQDLGVYPCEAQHKLKLMPRIPFEARYAGLRVSRVGRIPEQTIEGSNSDRNLCQHVGLGSVQSR